MLWLFSVFWDLWIPSEMLEKNKATRVDSNQSNFHVTVFFFCIYFEPGPFNVTTHIWAWFAKFSLSCINFPSTWFFSIDMESDTRIEVAQERLSSRRVWIGGEIKNDFNTLSTSHCIFCRGRLFCKVILHKDTIKFVLQWLNSGRFNLGANMDYAGCYTVQF